MVTKIIASIMVLFGVKLFLFIFELQSRSMKERMKRKVPGIETKIPFFFSPVIPGLRAIFFWTGAVFMLIMIWFSDMMT
jgi:hypothetical protein